MVDTRPNMLDPAVDVGRDHVLGPPDAEMTLVEYGSYTCPHCHAVHEVIEGLRSRFGERMRYVFRHLPVAGSKDATAIDVASGTVDGTIPLGGKPEFAVGDGAGHIYDNIEDTSEIVAIDAKHAAVVWADSSVKGTIMTCGQ